MRRNQYDLSGIPSSLFRLTAYVTHLFSLLHCASLAIAGDVDSNTVSRSSWGMAVTAQPEASRAAVNMLEQGGNAIDAAIAAAFAITVVEPTMSSIGGRAQILVRNRSGQLSAFDGMTEIPANFSLQKFLQSQKNGYEQIAVPGVVSALNSMHEQSGTLPWSQLLAPAISLAQNGFVLLPGEAGRQSKAKTAIQDNPGFQSVFLDADGNGFNAGETIKQPVLAKTLSTLSEYGAENFYRGAIADAIVSDMKNNGGFINKSDLENYQTLPGRILTFSYRGYDINTLAAPAGGGLVIKSLNILKQFNPNQFSRSQWAVITSQAIAIALETMNDDYFETSPSDFMNKNWGKQQAARIKLPDESVHNQDAFLSNLKSLQPQPAPFGTIGNVDIEAAATPDSHHTTHIVTADCAGNTVTMTLTLGPVFGAKVITPELGFVYASTMGDYLSSIEQKPGVRPRTSIAPTIVTRDGKLAFALGAAGGLRIVSSIVQTISNKIDWQMPLQQAVYSPRIHPDTKRDENGLRVSIENSFFAEQTSLNGWPQRQLEQWQQLGYRIRGDQDYGDFGRIQALERQWYFWQGVTDPDWEGQAMAPVMEETNKQCSLILNQQQ